MVLKVNNPGEIRRKIYVARPPTPTRPRGIKIIVRQRQDPDGKTLNATITITPAIDTYIESVAYARDVARYLAAASVLMEEWNNDTTQE